MNIYQKKDQPYTEIAKNAERSGHLGNYGPRDLLPIILGAKGNMYDICTGGDKNYKPLQIFIGGEIIELFEQAQKEQYETILMPYIPMPNIKNLQQKISKDVYEVMENATGLAQMRYNINTFIGEKLHFKGGFTTFSKELSKNVYQTLYTPIFQSIINNSDKQKNYLGSIFNRYIIQGKSYGYIKEDSSGLYFGDEGGKTVKILKKDELINSFFNLRKGLAQQTTGSEQIAFTIQNAEGVTISNEMNTFLSSIVVDSEEQVIENPIHIGGASMRNYAHNQKSYQSFFSDMRSQISTEYHISSKSLGIFPAHFYRLFGADKHHNEIISKTIESQEKVKILKAEKSIIFKNTTDKKQAMTKTQNITKQIQEESKNQENHFNQLLDTQTTKAMSSQQVMGGDLHDPKISQFDLYTSYQNCPDDLHTTAKKIGGLLPDDAQQIANMFRTTYQK